MRTIEAKLVEDGDVVGDPRGQRVGPWFVRRARTALPSVVGIDGPGCLGRWERERNPRLPEGDPHNR